MDNLIEIIGISVGLILIVFRRDFAAGIIQKQITESDSQKARDASEILKEKKLGKQVSKYMEIVPVIFGVFLILMGASGFFPEKAIYMIGIPVMVFFAAGAAGVVEFALCARFLMKDVRKYIQDVYPEYDSIQRVSREKEYDALSDPENDPILKALRKKAVISLIHCFVILFVVFIFLFYAIYRLTNR